MAVSERARHELYEWLRTEAGVDDADTFMELVPPTGWGDVATRRDLDLLRAEIRADLAEELRMQTITMTSVTIGALGMFVALNQLLG